MFANYSVLGTRDGPPHEPPPRAFPRGSKIIWMNTQSPLKITSESQEFLLSCFAGVFFLPQRVTVHNEDTEGFCPLTLCASSPSVPPRARAGRDGGFAVWFSSRGILIVSKWSPPATALIICDPGCGLEDHRGGRDQTPCVCACVSVCVCVCAVERKSRKGSYRERTKGLKEDDEDDGGERICADTFQPPSSSRVGWDFLHAFPVRITLF